MAYGQLMSQRYTESQPHISFHILLKYYTFQIYIDDTAPNNFCSFPKYIVRIKWDNYYKSILSNCKAIYTCKGVTRTITTEDAEVSEVLAALRSQVGWVKVFITLMSTEDMILILNLFKKKTKGVCADNREWPTRNMPTFNFILKFNVKKIIFLNPFAIQKWGVGRGYTDWAQESVLAEADWSPVSEWGRSVTSDSRRPHGL